MPVYRTGERVRLCRLTDEHAGFNGKTGIVVASIDRGPDACSIYDVELEAGIWTMCDCYLEAAPLGMLRLAPSFYVTVPWADMPWRPNLQRLPEYISAELNRRRRRR